MRAEQIIYEKARACTHPDKLFTLDHSDAIWERLYIKHNRIQGVVISNVIARNPGNGEFTKLVRRLIDTCMNVCVESPQPRLRRWCERNNIQVVGTMFYDDDELDSQ